MHAQKEANKLNENIYRNTIRMFIHNKVVENVQMTVSLENQYCQIEIGTKYSFPYFN